MIKSYLSKNAPKRLVKITNESMNTKTQIFLRLNIKNIKNNYNFIPQFIKEYNVKLKKFQIKLLTFVTPHDYPNSSKDNMQIKLKT